MQIGRRYRVGEWVGTYSCMVRGEKREPLWEFMTRDRTGAMVSRYVVPTRSEPPPADDGVGGAPVGLLIDSPQPPPPRSLRGLFVMAIAGGALGGALVAELVRWLV